MKKTVKKLLALLMCLTMIICMVPVTASAALSKTSSDAISWVKSKKGQTLDYDGVYGGQCVDLIYYYYVYLGVSSVGGNAVDYTTNKLPSGWTRTKGGTPKKGDIIIYAGNGGYGHVAIFEATTSTWHQNAAGYTGVCNLTTNYKNIKAGDGSGYWGCIHPNFKDDPYILSVYFNANGGSISSDTYYLSSNNIYKTSNSSKYYQQWTYNETKENGLIDDTTFGIYKTGYNFVGWGTSSSGGTIFDKKDNTIVPSDLNSNISKGSCSVTLYAIWEKVQPDYTLTYDANGGYDAPDCQSGSDTYIVTYEEPLRDGYIFLGWSTDADTTSPDYYGGEEISIDHDVTLYAVWEEDEYTVTFYGNGGTGVPDAERFYPGDSITIPEEIPSFTGYTFSGWSETADFSSTVYYPGDEVYFDSSTNLFAIWREFGAYEGYTGLEFTREQPYYIMKFVPEKTGEYVIKTTTVDEPVDTVGTLADSNNVLITENDDSDDDGNFKISYNFTKGKTYYIYVRTFNGEEGYVGLTVMPTATITYDANGGYDAPETQAHDIDYFISDDEPYRDGYEFIGWSEQRGADEASYYPGEDITVTENITLYAVWDKLASEFYVCYNANGGTNAPQTQFVGSNSIGYIPDEVPVRDGYEFTGWCVNLNGTGTWYYPGDMIRRSDDQEDITLYAMWEVTETPDPDPDPEPEPFGLVEIKTPSITTIRYGDSIILRANINNSVFDSLKITWEASNENFKVVSVSDDGKQCIITPVKSGETTFTAKIKMGNTVMDFDTQVMTAKAGFFDKLIAFIKIILGIGGTVYQQTISLYK